MPTDVEIAESARLRPIDEVAARIALRPNSIEKYGAYKAKVHLEAMTPPDEGRRPCRVVAVTAMSPTLSPQTPQLLRPGAFRARASRQSKWTGV